MNRLLEIGFQPAGHWCMHGDALEFELRQHGAQSNILYAFISDGEVMYKTYASRILGGTGLRDWFQANFKTLDKVTIRVLSQNTIRIVSDSGV